MKPDFDIILETPRFYLRQFLLSDAKSFFELNSDEDVMRYTGDEPFENENAALDFLKQYDPYSQSGMGRWAVIDKESGEYMGWCGLKYQPEDDEVDVGYRFFKRHWGKGVASETAQACIDYGFNELNLQRIIARVHPDNPASVRVLEKCGMKRIGTAFCIIPDAYKYEILKS